MREVEKKLKQRNITLLMLHTGSLNFVETACTLWYGLSSFQEKGTKLERFFGQNSIYAIKEIILSCVLT